MCYLHTGISIDSPDYRDYTSTGKQTDIEAVSHYIKDHMPGLDGQHPAVVETCLFTVSAVIVGRKGVGKLSGKGLKSRLLMREDMIYKYIVQLRKVDTLLY